MVCCQISSQNKWHSALQPGRSCSKKGHFKRVETEWTTTFDWWWFLEKSSPLESLQPKNSSDLHSLRSSFTCEMLCSQSHVLIFRMDSLLSNVKISALRLFFYFVMKRYFMINTCYYKIFCKNTCFVVTFPFVMENNLFAIIYNPKFHSTFFFLVEPFMSKGWIFIPSKFMGSR